MRWFEKNPELLSRDKHYIINYHPKMHFKENENSISIIGTLRFKKRDKTDYGETELEGEYKLRIDYSEKHPEFCPFVYEIDSKIDKDFHKLKNGALCLEVPNEIYRIFRIDPSVKSLIENLIIPYLYFHTYYVNFGKKPWKDWDHVGDGLVEYYNNICQSENPLIIIRLLKFYLSKKKYIGSFACPCKSKKKYGQCHKEVLKSKLFVPREVLIGEIDLLEKLLYKKR